MSSLWAPVSWAPAPHTTWQSEWLLGRACVAGVLRDFIGNARPAPPPPPSLARPMVMASPGLDAQFSCLSSSTSFTDAGPAMGTAGSRGKRTWLNADCHCPTDRLAAWHCLAGCGRLSCHCTAIVCALSYRLRCVVLASVCQFQVHARALCVPHARGVPCLGRH